MTYDPNIRIKLEQRIKMRKNKIFWLFLLNIIILTGCSAYKLQDYHTIKNGILDLKDWESTESKYIKLDGAWEFYWHSFITFEELSKEKPDLYTEVPDTWDSYTMKGEKLPGTGYATYRSM
jgi:hypothetical protein